MSHYKIWCAFRSENIPWTLEMTTWSPKKFNNFVIIKNNIMLLGNFTWLRMSNKSVEISCKNSEQLLRKWQKTLPDTFFCHTLYVFFLHELNRSRARFTLNLPRNDLRILISLLTGHADLIGTFTLWVYIRTPSVPSVRSKRTQLSTSLLSAVL